MHTTIFAASTRLWDLELKKLARAQPVSYESMRRLEDPRENKVRATTIRWARAIPSFLHPRALVTQFPRIANTMADLWTQPKIFHMYYANWWLTTEEGAVAFRLKLNTIWQSSAFTLTRYITKLLVQMTKAP